MILAECWPPLDMGTGQLGDMLGSASMAGNCNVDRKITRTEGPLNLPQIQRHILNYKRLCPTDSQLLDWIEYHPLADNLDPPDPLSLCKSVKRYLYHHHISLKILFLEICPERQIKKKKKDLDFLLASFEFDHSL